MITTSRRGFLATVDLNDGRELWRDPHGKSHAHLEHDEGWVVHDTNGRDAQGRSAHFQVGSQPESIPSIGEVSWLTP